MPGRGGDAVETLREPEYTGENRCLPCTVLNALLAVFASVLLGLVFPPLGLVALVASTALIYLRGYLVPGTPELTQRYLPDRIHRASGDHPAVRTSDPEPAADADMEWETIERLEYEREHTVDPEQYLVDAGAVHPDADRELAPDFAAAVEARMDAYSASSVGPDAVAELFQVSPDGLAFEDRDYPAIKVERRIRKWPSPGALVADVATHEGLTDRRDDWLEVPRSQRVGILETLRTYHDVCPECGGDLAFHDDTFESCCGRYEVAVYGCADCEAHLLELDPALVEADPDATGIVPDLDQH
jgi:ribosomal protein S27AE